MEFKSCISAVLAIVVSLLAVSPLTISSDSRPQHAQNRRQSMLHKRDTYYTNILGSTNTAIRSSPVQIGRAAQLFRNGRVPDEYLLALQQQQQQQQIDLFNCVEPTRAMYEQFARQYNRTFPDSSDKLERLNLFAITMKRAIMLNRIVQNEILNQTNHIVKKEIRNYHFIEPLNGQNLAIWYSDITDCELGLMKYIVFKIFYYIDNNDLAAAYRTALDNYQYLPLLNDDGFEQLANILLIRLYDRFQGDEKMNQLFEWPLYLKKLAGYAYNKRERSKLDPDTYRAKMALITYAYPAYFKDLKYNSPAVNRTGDNVAANEEHKRFNSILDRRFTNLSERNKRLAIFRQRWSLINSLNEQYSPESQDNQTNSMEGIAAEFERAYGSINSGYDANDPHWLESSSTGVNAQPLSSFGRTSEKLVAQLNGQELGNGRFRLTQFSDLTDLEFIALLSNDFSLLESNKDSAEFLDANFPVRRLDKAFRNEIAIELELRRSAIAAMPNINARNSRTRLDLQQQQQSPAPAGLALAQQVVDELISDVGLPMGPVVVEDISEDEYFRVFRRMSEFFIKPYGSGANSRAASNSVARLVALSGGGTDVSSSAIANTLSESELADERQKRYEQFKKNYGRFKAWFIKEGWQLDEAQLIAMLRLSDMSWPEIKLSLFKVCCLTEENRALLGATNATLLYIGSNSELMCRPMSDVMSDNRGDFNNLSGQQREMMQQNELAALELYYYYCVHFNKHHNNIDEFYQKFAIFRRNLDRMRRHSCARSLTLYESLRSKQPDILSTIDVLDPRRQFTDDLNLDRYEYFRLPRPTDNALRDADQSFSRLTPMQKQQQGSSRLRGSDNGVLTSRVGISYRREAFFDTLLDKAARGDPTTTTTGVGRGPTYSIAEKLIEDSQHVDKFARRYRQNAANKVYELVMQRYSYCMKATRDIDVDPDSLRQNCQSTGPLADQAVTGGISSLWSADNENDNNKFGMSGRLRTQKQGSCEFYRNGLEPWAEGLIKQDRLSAELILAAKC